MRLFGNYCMKCRKELKKGDKVIKINDFVIYHPECYKKDRKEAFEHLGIFDQHRLQEVNTNLKLFSNLNDTEIFGDSSVFFEVWGKQLRNIILLDSVLAHAEMFGSLGFIGKIRFKRRLNKLRTVLIELAESYREDYGTLQIERIIKEKFGSSGEPTIEQLKEEETKAFEFLREQILDYCDNLAELSQELSKLSRKTAKKIKDEFRRQIQSIPNKIQTF